jgi:hypothetical protein
VRYQQWFDAMSARLKRRLPDDQTRTEFLESAWYEATRAGLDPGLVLGLIQVESAYRKYAVSIVGARGYMQVMPFWTKVIGDNEPPRAVRHADEPALRLLDPAHVHRHGRRQPVSRAGPLQRQPRQAGVSECGAGGVEEVGVQGWCPAADAQTFGGLGEPTLR